MIGVDQSALMRRLVCAFIVHKHTTCSQGNYMSIFREKALIVKTF